MKKEEIAKKLRNSKLNSGIKLPKEIDFSISNKVLNITIKNPCKNMQTDDSAFEGWAVALKSTFGDEVKKIVLNLSLNANININKKHYSRFLWRAYNFSNIFDWFEIGNCKNDVDYFIANELRNVFVNKPSKDRGPVVNSEEERFIEYLFVDSNRSFYGDLRKLINADEILNQVPVGIFQDEISDNKMIFPGRASAIDLIGLKGTDTLHLIELKFNNYKVGIISEFLFYAFIMHNLFINKKFQYHDVQFPSSFDKYFGLYNNGNISRIDGYLLCDKYHPLIDVNEINLLNLGLSKFNISLNRIIYEYNKDINNPVISNLKII